MNDCMLQLLKLNILTLCVYKKYAIEDILMLKWEDVEYSEEQLKLRTNEKELILQDQYLCLFFQVLNKYAPKTKYVFLD